ncbi:hypothetical protein K8I61_20390 [bacterium]|nr:hypothetical protein [bacterium]
MSLAHYDSLAGLVAYPGPGFEAELSRAIALHSELHPGTAREIEAFREQLPLDDLVALRELHTRTFDVQPITTLDIGYTLFGEDYKRGALLANLSAEHTRAGNDCGAELADHLPNVLRLLPKMADAALREEFVRLLLAPALREMIRDFEPSRLAKKEDLYRKHHKTIIAVATGPARTAWRHALEAIFERLRADFALDDGFSDDMASRFAGALGTELAIEDGGTCVNNGRGA